MTIFEGRAQLAAETAGASANSPPVADWAAATLLLEGYADEPGG